MNIYNELILEKKNLFHFYIIVGNNEKNIKIVSDFLKNELKLNLIDNLIIKKGVELKIDEARILKKENSYSNNQGINFKKIFFLDYKKVNLEAQNALLKTFEETSENTHYFLFLPEINSILPTIKSRARIIQGENIFEDELVKKFIQSNFSEREKIIQKEINGENISAFLNSLEKIILEKKDLEFYKEFLYLKKNSLNKGAQLKSILNYIALRV